MLTALAAVGALVFTGLSLQATRESQITDRFSKAVEQLGTRNSLEVRLGGIYALERIARDSARDHPTVMEVLSAYVRVHVPSALCPPASGRQATDVQAILTVIGRRDTRRDRDRLALNDTCLIGANLSGADLTNADLTNANLTNANLTNANLTNANLTNANLTGVNLTNANLTGVNLTGARGLR
jgi:hypothetical protein